LLGSDFIELNKNERRNSIKVWVSKEERVLLEAKMKHYGYKTIAKYVRDAVIYENVTYVDLKGKQEIYDAYSDNTKQLKAIAKEIRHISKYATQVSSNEIKSIYNSMGTILKKQKEMINLIEKKLDLEVYQKVVDN